ncbi:MAG TPA: DinB family protein [Candidatus Limnocylindria bacterium]|nr:DinB family protein [Candidatus Limnocylindria bacterium]
MTLTTTDEPLLRHSDPTLARRLPSAIHEARAELPAIVADILAIPESALVRPWPWIGGGEEEVRYGIYRLHELFERAGIEAVRAIRAAGRDGGAAADIVAPATAARWDLHGLLASLSDADIDADPGGGEWTIRRTLGHAINAQRAYAWSTAWWQERGFRLDDPDLPPSIGDALGVTLPDEETAESAGSLHDIRARLDAILDLAGERLAGLPDDRLGHGARWSGFAVPVSFRLARWASHLREHTIQLEKTLVMLGRTPSELERLVRLTLAAYGRAEAAVFGQPDADDAAGVIRAAGTEARETIADARRAAET